MAPQVRSPAPDFNLPAVLGTETTQVALSDYAGKWVVFAWYPKDETAVCGSELPVFDWMSGDLAERNAVMIAASTQGIQSKLDWVNGDLGALGIPLLADEGGKVADAYGILLDFGLSLRATFIIDPEGILRWASINDLPVGRSSSEILRTLDALQMGEACLVNWSK